MWRYDFYKKLDTTFYSLLLYLLLLFRYYFSFISFSFYDTSAIYRYLFSSFRRVLFRSFISLHHTSAISFFFFFLYISRWFHLFLLYFYVIIFHVTTPCNFVGEENKSFTRSTSTKFQSSQISGESVETHTAIVTVVP